MAIFKCKMCGGTLEINNETVAVCQYCGTKQTLPKLDDDRKANLYDRANHFRRNNEFDKAMGIYEQILNDDNTDAESYWSLVLCRYGIEYVEDPTTHKRIPTVNRAQFTSIFDDEDYKSALQYADGYQKEVYEQEANAINEIQKGILAISQKEEPFDVFICYKETDNRGCRTPDSVLATELYNELTREGFKVFFARITLEDKLGQEYEPYIFAALNSAKVMVVLGTKPEYFNAVWVKNEWSRYIALIKNGARKMLIPAYKDMNPYDLPEEFSHLQAQDMSKLGFMQDLIRGIKKVIDADKIASIVVQNNTNVVPVGNVTALLDRGYMALEDSDWDKADDFFEQVLNQDAKNALAYLGKLLLELNVTNKDNLKDCALPFDDNSNYQKAIKFADNVLATQLKGYITEINNRNEENRKNSIFDEALKLEMSDNIDKINQAITLFESISQWKNSTEHIQICKNKIDELNIKAAENEEKLRIIKAEEDKEKILRKNRILKRCILGTSICIGIILLLFTVKLLFGNMINYNIAITSMEKGKYDKAIEIFSNLKDYKDSTDKVIETKYLLAEDYVSSEKYEEAYKMFLELKDYKDSAKKAIEYKTGEFSETVSIRVGCSLNGTFEFDSSRSENEIVSAEMKVKYYKGIPDYNNVEIIFDTYDYMGNFTGYWRQTTYRYIGEFKNNSITGKGKLYYDEFDPQLVYDGEFLNGMYDGEGNLYETFSNILRIKATFKEGNVFGEFIRYDDDGSIWNKGTVKNGIMNSERYGVSDSRNEEYVKRKK